MVLLMLTLELLLSGIGSLIVAVFGFAVAMLPYALVALPLYILYRAGRAVAPRLRRLRKSLGRKPAPAKAGAKAPVRKAAPPVHLRVKAEAPPPAKAASSLPPHARVYGEGLDILARQMRGPLRRGDIPWFLAFGVGGPALLATDPTHVRWPEDGNTDSGCWWFCEGAAILHAGADSADGSRLSEGWPNLVAAMRKRPMRRPLDGVLLLVGADELRAAAEREAPRAALAKRAAAMAARLRAIRDELGMVCPVHVVVVRAEALDGFADLCAAVPSAMLDGALGWTGQQDWALPFAPALVDEAFAAIHADLAALEADALSAGTAGPRLPLLPAAFDTLRHPLALFLTDALSTSEGEESFPLRGIALTGAHTPPIGAKRPVFAHDLLPGRAFAEAGYGRPTDAAFLHARRRRRIAQAALAASVAGLSVAAWQGYAGVSARVPAVASDIGDLRRALLARDAVVDAPMVGQVIAATAAMERGTLATPLLPTSLVGGFDENKRRLASVTMRRAVLRPIRDALLPSSTLSDLPPVTNPRKVEDLPSFRRLTAQLDRIGGRRDALERYDRFRRSSGFDELAALAESVYGAVPRSPVKATDGFITRIAAGADLPNLDAKTIAAAVRAESVQLAAPLAEELYSRNPLRQRALALIDRLKALPEPPATPTADDAAEIRKLTDAVAEAAGWPIAAALRDPSRGLPDAVKVPLQTAAIADLPGRDTTDRIVEALATAATAARAATLALETPQTGVLFDTREDGTPTPSPALLALPDLVAAQVQDAPPPAAASEPKAVIADAAPAPTAAPKPVPPAPEPDKPAAIPVPPPVQPPAPVPAPAAPPKPVAERPAPALPPLPEPTELPLPVRVASIPRLPEPDAGAAAVTKLAATFSQTLAGRFPFVRADLARNAPDADPQDVRRFLQQLDENRAAVARTASPELAAFLERIDTARPLLDAVVRATPVSVRFTYGVNRRQEIGAEHIIDWSARSGGGAVGGASAPAALVWKSGEPVLLSFRWAAGSPYRPKSAAANAAEAVAGDTLTLAERGPWALLRVLKGRPSTASGEDGALLRLALPTQTIGGEPTRDTVLFMAATIRAGGRAELPMRALDLPVRFPQ